MHNMLNISTFHFNSVAMTLIGIEDFYYIVALGIDKSENDLINLSIQTAKTSSSSDGSSEQSNEYKIYTVECDSIDTGINILNNYLNKQINLSHCSAIVFSEEIAKENIQNYMTTLGNNIEIRPTCNIIISSKSAVDVLNNISNSGESFSSRLYESIFNSAEYTGYTLDATFSNFLARSNNNKVQAIAIYAVVNDDKVQNVGTATFRNNVMIGKLSPLQTTAYLILENELKSCLITINNPSDESGHINLELKPIKAPDIDVNLVNNTPFVNINLDFQGDISSSGENFDYVTSNNLESVEITANQYIEKLIKDYLYTITKEYNSDISTFQGILASKFLTEDEFDKVHWNEVFKDSYFDVNVNTKITATHLFNRE